MLEELLTICLGYVAPFMLVLHGIKELGFMKKIWVWISHVMQIRQILPKIWYKKLSIHSSYWFDQRIFCLFFSFKLASQVFSLANFIFYFVFPFFSFSFFFEFLFCLDEIRNHPTSVSNDKLGKSTQCKSVFINLGNGCVDRANPSF